MPTGDIDVLYQTCRNSTLVTAITVWDTNNTRTDTSDDHLLWQIASEAGSAERRFTLGRTPTGFVTGRELLQPSSSALLRVQVKSTALPNGESSYFRESALVTGAVRVEFEEKPMTVEDFSKRNACG